MDSRYEDAVVGHIFAQGKMYESIDCFGWIQLDHRNPANKLLEGHL